MTRARIVTLAGKCEEVMAEMDENSIDAIVCDPPYGLEFMGKEFDTLGDGKAQQAWHYRWAVEAFRVLKPGGHLIAFGGTRTYHRLACAVEDAGFEVRDTIAWLYGSGFPKSLDVSKAIDRSAGVEREVTGTASGARNGNGQNVDYGAWGSADLGVYERRDFPATPEAQQWDGWGTALKPAYEPAILARKPFKGTVANNVLTHGTGALNIDGCRVGDDAGWSYPNGAGGNTFTVGDGPDGTRTAPVRATAGRWPANVLLTHHPDCVEVGTQQVKRNIIEADYKDMDSTVYAGRQDGSLKPGSRSAGVVNETIPSYECHESCPVRILDAQSGGASRFYYTAKASRSEREAGLLGHVPCAVCGELDSTEHEIDGKVSKCRRGIHPTVKPIKIMEYLVRLVTPPGGTVLDPFMGSGSTGVAAVSLGFGFVGVEMDPDYVEIAAARIRHAIAERRRSRPVHRRHPGGTVTAHPSLFDGSQVDRPEGLSRAHTGEEL